MRKDETEPMRWTQISPKMWGRMVGEGKLELCAGPGGDTELLKLTVGETVTGITLSSVVALLQAAKMTENDLTVGAVGDCPICPYCNVKTCEQRGKHEAHWHSKCGANSELPVNWTNATPRRQVSNVAPTPSNPSAPTVNAALSGEMRGAPGEDEETAEEIEARVAAFGTGGQGTL